MKMRSTIIIVLCALAVAGAWLLWRGHTPSTSAKPIVAAVAPAPIQAAPAPTRTLPGAKTAGSSSVTNTNRLAYRLTNTSKSIGQLMSDRHAILLENALIETDVKTDLSIPKQLRATGEPGAFIVQARGVIDAAFRAALTGAGGQIVSYIPNNAYLVQLTSAGASALSGNPLVQAVLPYEPYYKVQSTLLGPAVNQKPLAAGTYLTLGLYGSGASATEAQIQSLGGQIVGRDRSPFGPIVRVQPPTDWLALAQLPGVQIVEPAYLRKSANDLSRPIVGMSPTSISPETSDYLNLTGNNVMVEVNDSGVDATHPDLVNRVFGNAADLVDTDGHGTHVAGIIAGDGTKSTTVIFAEGSTNPPVADQYRGKARLAKIFAVDAFGNPDQYLQEAPALTNALISNNSWNYNNANGIYDLAAAGYDAATRDAVPEITGPQPVLFVFAAGNDGNGGDNGFDGNSDSILSPGTAKNVITVGALEENRNITNWVTYLNTGASNQWWLPGTDSSSQVAWFSGRGNVGIGIEGTYGRFKPDVVAPGTMVVSTRSQEWDTNAYYNDTNYNSVTIPWQIIDTNLPAIYSMTIPTNAVGIVIQLVPNALSPNPWPNNLKIAVTATNYAGLDPNDPTSYDFATSNNVVNIPPDGNLASFVASGHLYFAVADTTTIPVDFNVVETIITTNDNTYLQVLAGMNNLLGPYYRYESGTSMAAADVSGVLALMQDYFTNTLHATPSPALLKALLINGARSAWPGQYGYALNSDINLEGWGLVNLSNSLPATIGSANGTTTPLFFADQSPTNALATGDSQTYNVTTASTTSPLRVTLAWTDPPGNPAAAIKLVNSLELIVTNLTTGEAYYGNNYAPSTPPYSYAYSVSNAPVLDSVNNIQTIVIPPAAGTSFSVTVIGRSVNVNAVTTEQTNIVQDYALAVACDDTGSTGGVSVAAPTTVSAPMPLVTAINGTNQINFYQLVGANAPLLSTNFVVFGTNSGYASNAVVYLGQSQQWHFYVVTNTTSYTNAAFITFIPNTQSIPREGVFAGTDANSTRPEADLDLYVAGPKDANASSLTNLDPTVIANCLAGKLGDHAALDRGGTEYVAYSDAQPGDVYYVGVKCEDQMAGQFGFIGAFSLNPFSTMDTNGNEYVNAFNVPMDIPDGDNKHPGVGYVLGLALFPIEVRNVVVSNTVTHQNFGDLLGFLNHNEAYATLNNHDSLQSVNNLTLVYDDGETNEVPGAIPSDGPGTLQNFVRSDGAGVWLLTEVDDAITHTGRVENLQIKLEPHQTTNDSLWRVTVPAGGWYYDYVTVPVGVTNITVVATNLDSYTGLELALQYNTQPTLINNLAIVGLTNGTPFPGNSISYGPPVTPGTYWIGIYNPDTVAHDVLLGVFLSFSPAAETTVDFPSTGPVPLLDDAVTYDYIDVTNTGIIEGFNVGLRVDHPRISDLVFHLITPDGTRYLLMENRGGASTNGCGATVVLTNIVNASASGSWQAYTQFINVGTTSGKLPIIYNFYTAPDEMTVYYGTNSANFYTNSPAPYLIWDSGLISNPSLGGGPLNTAFLTNTVPFPPAGVSSNSTYLTIIMNQFGNPASTNVGQADFWTYTAGGIYTNYEYLAFTEDTNLTTTPIKFAPVPLVPSTNNPGILTNLYYQAEQSLAPLIGTSAYGIWQLEVLDNRAGATNNTTLLSWQLEFIFANPNYLIAYQQLYGFQTQTNTIATNYIQWYQVNVPLNPTPANFATNILDYASAPVNLWFSVNYPPTTDTLLLANSTNGIGLPVLSTNSTPLLVPGGTYYLGVQNTGNVSVTSVVEVDFDHGNLPPGPSSVHFSSAKASSNNTQLSWTLAAGSHYQIQWKDSLAGAWNTITNPATTTSNGVATFTDTGAQTAPLGPQRFYRLVWVP